VRVEEIITDVFLVASVKQDPDFLVDAAADRLDLGNFSGYTAEAIRQDVYSTVFVSNLEAILIAPANQQLQEDSAPLMYRQQVNHVVS
jgi:hypothetical protein